MNKLHERRWSHAVKIFIRINEYIRKKYIVFDEEGTILPNIEFVFDKENLQISQQYKFGIQGYFEEADLYITMKELEKRLNIKSWGFVNPKNIERFKPWSGSII